MSDQAHWESVYQSKQPAESSWYQPSAELSRRLITEFTSTPDARIIDVGAGASPLLAELAARGYTQLTAIDFSAAGLAQGQERAGVLREQITWLTADVTETRDWSQPFDVWHDRAVFHFLNTREERQAYVKHALSAIRPGGHLIISTFSLDGPPR
jgi:2-polyprenyl-3-methyl-5-hydroxy-6-metoxy-1,4-benzoquinol methylase